MTAGTLSPVPGDRDTPAAAPVNREELSLYAAPRPRGQYVEPEAGQLERGVASLRTRAGPYAARCRSTFDRVQPSVRGAVQLGGDAFAYLRNPPEDFYPRAGVIGLTGVLGLFLARGSRVKRLLYPAGLVLLSASLYYPERAAAAVRTAADSAYESAVRGYAAAEKLLKSDGP